MSVRARVRARTLATAVTIAGAVAAAAFLMTRGAIDASAQPIDANRPLHVTLGAPPSATHHLLPTTSLRQLWTGAPVAPPTYGPLPLPNGHFLFVSSNGEFVALDEAGRTDSKAPSGVRVTGTTTLLNDGTLLFLTIGGEAIGFQSGHVRFRTRISFDSIPCSKPLALPDGGAIIERAGDLVALDGSGAIRARVSLHESVTEPLFILGDSVVAIGGSGSVHLWAPGGELTDSGSFSGRTQGVIPSPSAAHSLTSVVDGRIVDLDLVRKLTHVRAEPSRGALSGPPLKVGNDVAAVLLDGSHVDLWQVGPDGDDHRRVNLAVVSALVTDAGIETLGTGFNAIVDDVGTVAFAIPSGPVGVVGTDGRVTTTASQCNSGRTGTPILQAIEPPPTSSGGAALLVACANGNVQDLASSQK